MYEQIHRTESVVGPGVGPQGADDQSASEGLLRSDSPAMQRILEQLDYIAAAEATVLIGGESGTGKGVLANALHQRSRRRGRPFVRLNCAGLPESLLESELFGHERGAFTGAIGRRAGRFELADRGTLFLDEIGAASEKVQLRLLRVLQEREFERVGGTQTLRVNVRLIAATNADLGRAVKEGSFRGDLYYRLNVVPIRLPPLRQRREDIPMLARHFVRQAGRRNRRPALHLADEVLDWMRAYPWPGNIRQLENAVERMVVLARGTCIGARQIPEEMRHWTDEEEQGNLPFKEARQQFERHYLRDVLSRYNGVISQVADAIGMSRKNLYMKLEQLDIDYDGFRRP